jgi:thioredoxin-like negative regulator of GroEL
MSRREQLEELLETDPDDVFLHYALALEYVSDGDVSEGLQKLAELTDRNPDYVAAYFRRGQILVDQNEVNDAREILARGIEVARKTGDAHAEREMSEFLDTLT